ncbi:hypothetical protein OAK75_08690 [Bacteriovoracales bacterium]|nr:hypothetical protein [Bacteriovoracales bacterium]
MKKFTSDVVDWWVKWSRIHRKSNLEKTDAEKELALLKEFVAALKNYHK